MHRKSDEHLARSAPVVLSERVLFHGKGGCKALIQRHARKSKRIINPAQLASRREGDLFETMKVLHRVLSLPEPRRAATLHPKPGKQIGLCELRREAFVGHDRVGSRLQPAL